MSNCGKGAFYGVGCSDVFPVLSREVIERQEHVAIFEQLAHGLVVFHAVCRVEEVKRALGRAIARHELDEG